MPIRPLRKARFVPPLTLRAESAVPLTWDGADYVANVPGGAYLPHEFALALELAIADVIGESEAVACAAKPVVGDSSGALSGISIVVSNRGSADLVLRCDDADFSLEVVESTSLGIGPQHGTSALAVDAGEEATLLEWPLTGLWPLTLAREGLSFESAGRIDIHAETGRRVSWAGSPRATLRGRLLALPQNAQLAPANWSYGNARWYGPGEGAPLCALFGPGAAAMNGAPMLLVPDDSSDALIPLELSGRGASLQRRLHGFVDLHFEAEEQSNLGSLRRTGTEYTDDFSGDLSKWSGPSHWSIVSGELQVNTTGSASVIVFDDELGDSEVEMQLRFLAVPAEGEFVLAGPGIYLGSGGYLGIGLRGRTISGELVTEIATWTSGTPAATGVVATLQRALPTSGNVSFRAQFLSNPQSAAPGTLRIRAWVDEEGPFVTKLLPGTTLPALRRPCLLYQDDLATDPGPEALFDDFIAREILWDLTPNLRNLEAMDVD